MSELHPVIDHVVINVATQLDAAAAQYARLGFDLTERGHHSLGSSNHLAIFGRDYLELLGVEPSKEGARVDFLRHPPGLAGLVFKPPADACFAESLNASGVRTEQPREFHRPVRTSDGEAEARFRTTNLSDARVQNGRVFFCHHVTPELVWRDEWRGHPNGATGVAEFMIAASDPDRIASLFRALFGGEAVLPTPGGYAVPTGTASILLLKPEEVARRLGDAAPVQADGTDRMVALSVRVKDVAATAALLLSAGIVPSRSDADRLVVPSTAAAGLALSFIC